MNRPITKEEMQRFKEDKNVSAIRTGLYPSRSIRNAQKNMMGRSPMTSKNNRKTTKARIWLHNFIKGVYNKYLELKAKETTVIVEGTKMSIQEAYMHSKGPEVYSKYLHRRGIEL